MANRFEITAAEENDPTCDLYSALQIFTFVLFAAQLYLPAPLLYKVYAKIYCIYIIKVFFSWQVMPLLHWTYMNEKKIKQNLKLWLKK
jgi:hypothetical protein